MKVEKVEILEVDDTEVYDIGVADNHNFFVFPHENSHGVLVHNCHRANAHCFSEFLNNTSCFYKFGLSATPERKDKREVVVRDILGPVNYRVKAETLTPKIYLHDTGVQSKSKYSGPAGFTYCIGFLSGHENRNDYIFSAILADMKKGRNIVVPVLRVEHAKQLVKRINDHFEKDIAAAFLGGQKEKNRRKQIVDDARSRKIRVVVGIRKLLQLGINVPAWDTLYYIMPMSNEPNWKQESARVLTPDPDKKQPIIRVFYDSGIGLSMGCARATLSQSFKFGHRLARKTGERVDEVMGRRGPAADDPGSFSSKKKGKAESGGIGRHF